MTGTHGCAVTSQDSGRQYKTFRGLAAELEPPEYEGKPGRSLHLFLGNNSLTSLSAHRNDDGTYSGTLGLRSGGARSQPLQGGQAGCQAAMSDTSAGWRPRPRARAHLDRLKLPAVTAGWLRAARTCRL